jgi:hypothetical protein
LGRAAILILCCRPICRHRGTCTISIDDPPPLLRDARLLGVPPKQLELPLFQELEQKGLRGEGEGPLYSWLEQCEWAPEWLDLVVGWFNEPEEDSEVGVSLDSPPGLDEPGGLREPGSREGMVGVLEIGEGSTLEGSAAENGSKDEGAGFAVEEGADDDAFEGGGGGLTKIREFAEDLDWLGAPSHSIGRSDDGGVEMRSRATVGTEVAGDFEGADEQHEKDEGVGEEGSDTRSGADEVDNDDERSTNNDVILEQNDVRGPTRSLYSSAAEDDGAEDDSVGARGRGVSDPGFGAPGEGFGGFADEDGALPSFSWAEIAAAQGAANVRHEVMLILGSLQQGGHPRGVSYSKLRKVYRWVRRGLAFSDLRCLIGELSLEDTVTLVLSGRSLQETDAP